MDLLYGPKNGRHAFGHNSTESEPILDEIWNIVSWRLALTDFGRDPLSSDSLRKILFFVW